MSAKEGATTTTRPASLMAHGACSREEPQPKLSPATRILARFLGSPCAVQGSRLRTKSGLRSGASPRATPSGLWYRSSAKAANPRPVRLMVLRYSLGMIMSVSTFWMSSGAARPSTMPIDFEAKSTTCVSSSTSPQSGLVASSIGSHASSAGVEVAAAASSPSSSSSASGSRLTTLAPLTTAGGNLACTSDAMSSSTGTGAAAAAASSSSTPPPSDVAAAA
mmetsp:Transcript_14927/g.59858  ORF Transcript_14927/g.59858 Transcript_14927/m.59858 type:complete len:221 (+) Transcript_14927:1053-1715(+)